MAWFYLVVAGLLEVAWAISMKQSEGFSRLAPSVATILLMIVSFGLLAVALKQLPVGTAYAVWTGIGAVGTAVVGILLFNEPAPVAKIVCITLIASGIVGLKVFGS